MAKVTLSERKTKFICIFPNVNNIGNAKVTKNREQNKRKYFFILTRTRNMLFLQVIILDTFC
jgi:hypothetical protein